MGSGFGHSWVKARPLAQRPHAKLVFRICDRAQGTCCPHAIDLRGHAIDLSTTLSRPIQRPAPIIRVRAVECGWLRHDHGAKLVDQRRNPRPASTKADDVKTHPWADKDASPPLRDSVEGIRVLIWLSSINISFGVSSVDLVAIAAHIEHRHFLKNTD
jgi:hypothetical protein